jgi:hypothetical protein
LNDTITIKVKQTKNKRSLERHVTITIKQAKHKRSLEDTITIKIKQAKNKRSLERHHNYHDKTNKQQKISSSTP